MSLGLGTWLGLGGGSVSTTTDFVMVVATTSPSESFTILCQNVGTFDATVDWGDGSTSSITAYNDGDLAHTYASAGDHEIRISGTFPNIYFHNIGDKLKVKAVTNLGVVGWQTMKKAFSGCSNMTEFTTGNTDAHTVTDVSEAFNSCSGLTTPPDVSRWTQITNAGHAFANCTGLTSTPNVSGWTPVTDASYAFYNCSNLTTTPDVSGWTLVTSAALMFYNCSGLTATPNVSGWTQITDASYTFFSCSGLTTPPDVSNWTLVTNAAYTFYNCSGLTSSVDLSNWNPTILTNGSNMMNSISAAGFDQTAYDAALVAWDAGYDLSTINTLAIDFGSAKYSETAIHSSLVTNGWTITDGGAA